MTSDARFREFHRNNPHVYDELVKLARRAKAAGRSRIGIRMLWERMRWEFTVETVRAAEEPKLNDHYTSKYARLIMDSEPGLEAIFETRG